MYGRLGFLGSPRRGRTKPVPPEEHSGRYSDFLPRIDQEIRRARETGPRGIGAIVPKLYEWIADWRMIRIAFDQVRRLGGPGAGPDGVGPRDLDLDEGWQLCTALQQAMLDGSYCLGKVRLAKVPKPGKRGFREIAIPNLADRVASASISMVLTRVVEPDFDPDSFGFRKDLGRDHAIVRVEEICRVTGKTVILVNDIRNAFPSVPRSRLMDIVRLRLPDDRLCRLIECSIRSRRTRGLLQGLPLSPLLLNVHLDHFLDKPWRRSGAGAELLRYADDLLLLFGDVDEAESLHRQLQELLHPTGMRLKYNLADSVNGLILDQGVDWLGWNLRWDGDELVVSIAEPSWEHLRDGLQVAQKSVDAPFHAVEVVTGWAAQQGPCFHPDRFDPERFTREVRRVAAGVGFEELPATRQIETIARQAWDRFARLRTSSVGRSTDESSNYDQVENGVSAVLASA